VTAPISVDSRSGLPGPSHPGLILRLLLPFLGYFLLFAAWAVATPYDGTPDEMRHIVRAYGVASGQFAPTPAKEGKMPGAYHDVPRSLIRTNCFAFHPAIPASCGRPPGGNDAKVRVLTPAGRYNPAYYLAVGWPLKVAPDMKGVLLARLLSAALVAALFAWATAVALTLRHRGVFGGILLAVTPITAHLAGAVNPNGPEIAAGAALVVALLAVLMEPEGAGRRRSAWWLAGIAGGVLLTVRSGGPAWFAVIAAVMLVSVSIPAYRALLRSRRFWMLAGWFAAVGLASVGWTTWKRTAELTPVGAPTPMPFGDAMKVEVLDRWRRYFEELIGVLSWLDTNLPAFVPVIWWLALGGVVALALAIGGPADRWRVAGLAVLGMLVPSVVEATNAGEYGFLGQGRYFLPILVGVPILAAYVVAGRGLVDVMEKLTRLYVVILVPLHLVALDYLMARYQGGLPPRPAVPVLNPFNGSWHPALGSVTPVLLAVASAAVLIGFHWRLTSPRWRAPSDTAVEKDLVNVGDPRPRGEPVS
jgi:hypothetical protein